MLDHSRPEKSEAAALFPRLGLCIVVKTKLFKHEGTTKITARGFLKYNSKMTGDCYVFKVLWSSVEGKHLMRFQSEKHCTVDGT